jgi:hypothetical protein
MLRPMIENMQNSIRQQNGSGLDPFGNNQVGNNQNRLESELSENVSSLMLQTMAQQAASTALTSSSMAPAKKAKLEDKPWLSLDTNTLQGMETWLHALPNTEGVKGLALTEEEHSRLSQIVQKLLADDQGMMTNNVSGPETEAKLPASTVKAFDVEDYLLLEKLIVEHPKAQAACLFILRLMFAHDKTSNYSELSIVKELIRRLTAHITADTSSSVESSSSVVLTGFASVPSHVMALCAISNLISHDQGIQALYQPTSENQDQVQPMNVQESNFLNELIDAVLHGLNNDRAEVRQMSAALAYNLTLASTKDYHPSGPWMEANGKLSEEINAHALQLLCACLERISEEKVSESKDDFYV